MRGCLSCRPCSGNPSNETSNSTAHRSALRGTCPDAEDPSVEAAEAAASDLKAPELKLGRKQAHQGGDTDTGRPVVCRSPHLLGLWRTFVRPPVALARLALRPAGFRPLAVPVSLPGLPAVPPSSRLSRSPSGVVRNCSSAFGALHTLRDVRVERTQSAPSWCSAGENEALGRRLAVPAGRDLEGNLLPFVQRSKASPLDGADMDEYVSGAILRLDEPVTLGRVEPLDSTCSHYHFLSRQSGEAPPHAAPP